MVYKKGSSSHGEGLKASKEQKKKNFKAFQKGFKKTTSGFGLNRKKK